MYRFSKNMLMDKGIRCRIKKKSPSFVTWNVCKRQGRLIFPNCFFPGKGAAAVAWYQPRSFDEDVPQNPQKAMAPLQTPTPDCSDPCRMPLQPGSNGNGISKPSQEKDLFLFRTCIVQNGCQNVKLINRGDTRWEMNKTAIVAFVRRRREGGRSLEPVFRQRPNWIHESV